MSGGDAAQGSGAAGTTRSEAVTTAVEHLVDERFGTEHGAGHEIADAAEHQLLEAEFAAGFPDFGDLIGMEAQAAFGVLRAGWFPDSGGEQSEPVGFQGAVFGRQRQDE